MATANQVSLVSGVIRPAGTHVSAPWYVGRDCRYLAVQSNFARTSGGTTLKVYLQFSVDDGQTWADVASHAFTTTSGRKVSAVKASTALAAATVPTDGSLTDDTILSGLIGTKIRVKTVIVGTYVGTLDVSAVIR